MNERDWTIGGSLKMVLQERFISDILVHRAMNTMFSTQELINNRIKEASSYKTGLRDGNRFHISDAGNCYRMRIYKRLGIEPTREIEIGALRKMRAGDAGHKELQYLLGKSLFLSECEVGDENIVGHPDGVVNNGKKVLLEIKTIEKWGMGYIKKKGAKREHELQMKTYWKYLRKDLSDLDNAVLSYIKREDFEAHDFYYIWSDKIAQEVDNEWKPLLKHWEEDTLPPCTCKGMYDGAGTKYCRYGVSDTECCSEKLYENK